MADTRERAQVRATEMTPWLSVVIPTHDGAPWIARALTSVAASGDPRIECILIDSSSTPETVQIAQSFATQLTLRIRRRPDLLPWTAKTNNAVEIARAPLACMLHQDDCWFPGRIAAIRQWAAAHPDGSVFVNPSRMIDAQDRVLGIWHCPLPPGPVGRDTFFERLLVQNFLSAPAMVFPRSAFLQVGGMDTALWYTADWDLYLKLTAVCDVFHCPQAVTGFRIHGGSLTVSGSRDLAAFTAQLRTVLDRHAPRLQSPRHARVLRAAEASIAVNVALAAAVHGEYRALPGAASQLLRLGPAGLRLYLRDSRLIDRLLPRIRAQLTGRFARSSADRPNRTAACPIPATARN